MSQVSNTGKVFAPKSNNSSPMKSHIQRAQPKKSQPTVQNREITNNDQQVEHEYGGTNTGSYETRELTEEERKAFSKAIAYPWDNESSSSDDDDFVHHKRFIKWRPFHKPSIPYIGKKGSAWCIGFLASPLICLGLLVVIVFVIVYGVTQIGAGAEKLAIYNKAAPLRENRTNAITAINRDIVNPWNSVYWSDMNSWNQPVWIANGTWNTTVHPELSLPLTSYSYCPLAGVDYDVDDRDEEKLVLPLNICKNRPREKLFPNNLQHLSYFYRKQKRAKYYPLLN